MHQRIRGVGARRRAQLFALVVLLDGLLLFGCRQAHPADLVLVVEGMHCASCEAAITDALGRLPGASKARASHKEGKAWVTVAAATQAAKDAVRRTVVGLGYRVKSVEPLP